MTLPSVTVSALGSTATIAVGDPAALLIARSRLVRELRGLDLAASRFRDDSALTALNRRAGRWHPVDERLWELVVASLEVARMTGGLVDPTIGIPMRSAGYDRTFTRLEVRDGAIVPLFRPAGGWQRVELEPRERTIRIPLGVELDLGASAKAFAADRIAQLVFDETGSGALVSIGGDIGTAGPAPEGGWVVGIADDHSVPAASTTTRVAIEAGGLASSGTRVRRWRTKSGELHHILDPATGRPARSPWSTVTVAAATCLEANAASTAAVVLGEAASPWLDGLGLPARLARLDGRVVSVGGWPAEERVAA
jgi:thiamine biosynthesis lipoprotein